MLKKQLAKELKSPAQVRGRCKSQGCLERTPMARHAIGADSLFQVLHCNQSFRECADALALNTILWNCWS